MDLFSQTWKTLRNNWVVALSYKFTVILFFLTLAILIIIFPQLPPLVPVWYSRPWGEEQLANTWWLFLLPVSSLLWFFATVVMSVFVTAQYLVFTQLLFVSSLLVNLLSFLAIVKIVFLVT